MPDPIQTAFSLHRRPFDKDLPPDDLWLDADRSQALQRLIDAVIARQHVFVKGEPGTGKNCALRALRERLPPTAFRLVYVSNVTLGRRDFYRQVAHALGLQARGTPAALFEAIQRDIESLNGEHRVQPVLILDEAQLMPEQTLSHLHVLCNFDWDSKPLLSLVLVGLPELHDRLRRGVHRSLLTRISACIEIAPVTADQTAAYVRKRLDDAGARAELFTPDALVLLHEATTGVLRSVDIVADASLRLAAHKELRLVDRTIVRQALRQTPLA
jgi:type II secretory pathway predicted ATPase ExeA